MNTHHYTCSLTNVLLNTKPDLSYSTMSTKYLYRVNPMRISYFITSSSFLIRTQYSNNYIILLFLFVMHANMQSIEFHLFVF